MLMRLDTDLQRVERVDLKPGLSDAEARIALMRISLASRDVMADSMRRGWFCLHVEKDAERAVEKVLRKGRINTYLPCFADTITARRGNAKCPKVRPGAPVYPSYVMVECAFDMHAFLGLNAILGVYDVIGGAGHPFVIRDEIMRRFIDMIDGGVLDRIEADSGIKAGDAVRVRLGPWADWQVMVLSVRGGVVKIDVTIFGRSHRISMPLAFVVKL